MRKGILTKGSNKQQQIADRILDQIRKTSESSDETDPEVNRKATSLSGRLKQLQAEKMAQASKGLMLALRFKRRLIQKVNLKRAAEGRPLIGSGDRSSVIDPKKERRKAAERKKKLKKTKKKSERP